MYPPPKSPYCCHLCSCVPKFNHYQNGPETKHDKPDGYHIGECRINPQIFLLTRYRKLFSETHNQNTQKTTCQQNNQFIWGASTTKQICEEILYNNEIHAEEHTVNKYNKHCYLFLLAHHRKPHAPTTRQVVPTSLHSNVQTGIHTAARPSFYPWERFNLLTCTNKSKTSRSHPQGVIIHSGKKAKQIMSGYV